jgi:hypothetical protein
VFRPKAAPRGRDRDTIDGARADRSGAMPCTESSASPSFGSAQHLQLERVWREPLDTEHLDRATGKFDVGDLGLGKIEAFDGERGRFALQ